jgi:hypothetical protein
LAENNHPSAKCDRYGVGVLRLSISRQTKRKKLKQINLDEELEGLAYGLLYAGWPQIGELQEYKR